MGCHFLLQGNLPDPGIKPLSLISPVSAGRFFMTSVIWEPLLKIAVPQLRGITPEVTVHVLETGSSLHRLQYQPLCRGLTAPQPRRWCSVTPVCHPGGPAVCSDLLPACRSPCHSVGRFSCCAEAFQFDAAARLYFLLLVV